MDDSEIDKFLAETNALDDSICVNPPYSSFLQESSPMVARPTGSPMPTYLPPPSPSQAFVSQSVTMNTFYQPRSRRYPTQHFPRHHHHQLAVNNNFLLDTKSALGSSSNFANSLGQVIHHDRDGVICYLAGVVRPGPDVPRIYKCKICSMEFPTSHAYGGHRSAHSKSMKIQMKERKVESDEKPAKKMKKNDENGKKDQQ